MTEEHPKPDNGNESDPDRPANGEKLKAGSVIEAQVVRVDSRMCQVSYRDEMQDCRIRGNLFRAEKRFSRPIAVGDFVRVEIAETPPNVVVEVLPRRNFLGRQSQTKRHQQIMAANIDQVVLVLACANPELNPRLLDRMLAAVEAGGFEALILVNKVDLLAFPEDLEPIVELYRSLDYRVILTSVVSNAGIQELRDQLKDQVSVFAGMSGVGKSALLTAVQPGLKLRSAEVSSATGKGKHTTTHSSLLKLDFGGFVVDTPGIREFGVINAEPAQLGYYFVDFHPYIDKCRFRSCTHDHEHKCAVKDAVDREEIDAYRYDSYLRILASLAEKRR